MGRPEPGAVDAVVSSTGSQPPAQCEDVPLAVQAATLIQLLARELRRDEDSRLRDAPLTAPQLAVAAELAARGSRTVGELAGAVCCVPANITALVDRLERKGFARRSASALDRRVTTISLTPAGEAALAATRGTGSAASRIAEALDGGRATELVGILGPLYLAVTNHKEEES